MSKKNFISEKMDYPENNQPVQFSISVNNEIKEYLTETSKWGKFLAIVGYIGMGLLFLLGLGVMIGFSIFSSMSKMNFPIGVLGLVYIIIAVVYYFPVNYLYKFSTRMRAGIESNDQEVVTNGFENLKSLFKFMGIFTIVVLSIYVLALIAIVPISMMFLK
jgi:hypothetical protein